MFNLLEEKVIGLILLPYPEAPQTVEFLPRVLKDMKDLEQLTTTPTPVQMLLWPVSGVVWVAYGFDDAAQEVFGDKLKPLNFFLSIHIGFWCTADSEKSSNNREYRNLKNFITVEAKAGRLTGREV